MLQVLGHFGKRRHEEHFEDGFQLGTIGLRPAGLPMIHRNAHDPFAGANAHTQHLGLFPTAALVGPQHVGFGVEADPLLLRQTGEEIDYLLQSIRLIATNDGDA